MHIDGANQITVAPETAGAADPVSVPGLMFMPTSGTAATGSSFRAGEARDVSLVRFVGQIINVFAIFPLAHALIVMLATIFVTYAMWIANEKGAHLVFNTEVDDLTGGFMAQITDAPFVALTCLVLGPLQLSPATGVLLAAALLLGKLTQLLMALAFERTNATTCNNERFSCIGRGSRQMDFSQVNRRLVLARSGFGAFAFEADMQFKAPIPDQGAGSGFFGQIKRQNQRLAPFPHWQNHPSLFLADGLSRPLDRIEAFGAPRILHLHLGMRLAKLTGGFDIGKKGMDHHLNRLTMQRKTALSGLLKLVASRPFGVLGTGQFMSLHA